VERIVAERQEALAAAEAHLTTLQQELVTVRQQAAAAEQRLVAARHLIERLCIAVVVEQEAVPIARALTALEMTPVEYDAWLAEVERLGKIKATWWANGQAPAPPGRPPARRS
jgi:uncharacterized protein YPO0396